MNYVTTKAVKRMESYRARGSIVKAAKKLLLPISFGPSSTCLLSILDGHLQSQIGRRGRMSYEIFPVHVNIQLDYTEDSKRSQASIQIEKLKARFPSHTFLSAELNEAIGLEIDWQVLGLEAPRDKSIADPGKVGLEQLLRSIPSATSRSDIIFTLLTRLLVDLAKKNDCESILFGDSTTRLAEKTLTETAKGRGFSLPWQVSDGMSPYGVNFHYPMRDLLKKELVTFSGLTSPPLTDLIIYQSLSTAVSVSAKSTTIDDLMAQYFESVEENYPSIVANVVRTSSKLKAPPAAEIPAVCGLCGLPVAHGTDGIYGWGGDQSSDPQTTKVDGSSRGILCYGCSRSIDG
jgi:cytoplasmic tRNA 2-thiolation protein 2